MIIAATDRLLQLLQELQQHIVSSCCSSYKICATAVTAACSVNSPGATAATVQLQYSCYSSYKICATAATAAARVAYSVVSSCCSSYKICVTAATAAYSINSPGATAATVATVQVLQQLQDLCYSSYSIM